MAGKEYTTLDQKTFKIGQRFFEIQRQLITGDVDKEQQFLSISKGYIRDDGTKSYRKTCPLPPEPDLLEELMEAAIAMAEDLEKNRDRDLPD